MASRICSSICSGPKETPPQFIQMTRPNVRLLTILNVLLCHFVVSPLVISNWAYIWHILDSTGKTVSSSAISCCFGFLVLMILCLGQFFLKRNAVSSSGKALPIAASSYNILLALASIVFWRGIWTAMDVLIGTDIRSCVWSFLFGVLFLLPSGSLKTSAMSPPFTAMNDNVLRHNGAVFDFPTTFEQKEGWKLFLDALFSILGTSIGVVAIWRSLWIPQDIWLVFEDDDSHRLKSNLVSCLAGWTSASILIVLQPPMDSACRQIENRWGWWYRFTFESFWSLAQSLSTALLWRGIYNLSQAYLNDIFVGIPELHASFTMALFTTLLLEVLSMNSNTGAKGCARDGSGIGNFIHYFVLETETLPSEIP